MADANDILLNSLFNSNRLNSVISDSPALNAFASTLSDNNMYKMAASPILAAKFDTSTWKPATTLGVTAAQSFLGSLLGQLGQRWEADQMAQASSVLPQLMSDPSSVVAPEGISPAAFEKMRLAATREKAIREAESASTIQKLFGQAQMKEFEKKLDLEYGPKQKAAEKLAEFGVLGADNPELPANKLARELEGKTYERIVALPQYKMLADVDSNFRSLGDLAKQDSKAADIGLISTVARIRDPQSTVREGEYQINADTQSLLNKIAGNWESVVTGQSRLNEVDKARLIASVVPKYNELGASYLEARNPLIEALKLDGGNPAKVPTIDFKPVDLGSVIANQISDLKTFVVLAQEAGLSKEQARAAWSMRGGN